ncbi:5-formyltetrahydrofolate cyclo-ligase [Thrips palmi]|uniref:5-formyltetrahydrofolate cyclo-ligase n=1 Tax=Thrips palmi TaxID=161013 RepID=A0A6P8Z425_THRPL|nr:5-formyltetrahydrofolate cyclo-ligase [Thrips palmi]
MSSANGQGIAHGVEVMRAAKAAVRTAIESRLAGMTTENKAEQSQQVLRKLLQHPSYVRSTSVAVFLSTAAEVDTRPVLAALFSSGKACFVPRYAYGKAAKERTAKGLPGMEMVLLRDMQDFEALPTTPWGIPQPAMDEPRHQPGQGGLPPLDLVLMPGVGFTTRGDRLGHGMGFYDKFLAALPAPKPATIALAFREQVVDELPTTDRDYTVDAVLTAD